MPAPVDTSLAFPPRRSGDENDLSFDWTKFLASSQETITSVLGITVSVDSGVALGVDDLQVVSTPTITGTVVSFIATGGVEGTVYNILCRIQSSQGFEYGRSATVLVDNI